jgi:hypothetical protein
MTRARRRRSGTGRRSVHLVDRRADRLAGVLALEPAELVGRASSASAI